MTEPTHCAICEGEIASPEHSFQSPPMHWRCLFAQEEVDEILEEWFDERRATLRAGARQPDPRWTVLVDSPRLLLAVNPHAPAPTPYPGVVTACVAETGLELTLPLQDFPDNLRAWRTAPLLFQLPEDRRHQARAGIDLALELLAAVEGGMAAARAVSKGLDPGNVD